MEVKHDEVTLRRILDDKFLASFGASKPYAKEAFIKPVLTGYVDPTESQTLTDQNVIVDHDTAVVVGIDTVGGTENGTTYETAYCYTVTYIYFLDDDAKSATYGNQSAREKRRMIGGRYFNRLPGEPPNAGFDYDWVPVGFFRESLDPCMGRWFEHRMGASRSGVAHAFRSAGRRYQRRRGPIEYTWNIQRAIFPRGLFRSEVRTYRAGRSIQCPAPVCLPPRSERD